MKTEDLIAALSADTLPQKTVGQQLARALPVAMGISIAAFVAFWGPRPDIWTAMGSVAVLKTLLPLGLVVMAAGLALSLTHPGMRHRVRGAALGLFVVVVLCGFGAALLNAGLAGLVMALSTPSLVTCLLSIPALGVPILLAVLWALSSGAALRPRLTGAVAGVVAGGLAASVYSLYCDKDMILFVVPAYFAAIAFIAAIGALLGPRVLKW
ncbi:NrsF family protein [Roseinatronobacter sp. NSM]|uniref:NrsF family protein n=1 Tax=Roseinatronobacter sp. NSM TaxID=3457785 RepID=UPI004035C13C